MRLAILDLPDDRVDLITAAQRVPGVDIVLVVHFDDDALALKIAEVLQIPFSTNPLDLLGLKPDQVALPSFESPSAAVLSRAGITSGIFTTLDALEQSVGGEALAEREALATAPRSEQALEEPGRGRLGQILDALALTGDRKRLFGEVLALAVERADADAGSIMILDEERNELRIAFAEGLSHETMRETRQKLGEGVAGRVASEGRPIVLNAPGGEARHDPDRDRHRITASMSVPIQLEDRVIGVLNVSSSRTGKQFGDADLEQVVTVTQQISSILERALQGARRDLDAIELRMRRDVEQALASRDRSPEDRMRRAARVISRHIKAEVTRLYVLAPATNRLSVISSTEADSVPSSIVTPDGILARALQASEAIVLAAEAGGPTERDRAPVNLLLAPMRGSRSVGVLGAECIHEPPGEPQEFGRLVAGIAGYMARLLDEERVRDSVERRGRLYAGLADLAPRLVMAADLDALAREALEGMRALFPGRTAVVRLRGRDASATSERRLVSPGDEDPDLLEREATVAARLFSGDSPAEPGPVHLVRPVRMGDQAIGTLTLLTAETAPSSAALGEPGAGSTGAEADALDKLASYVSLAWSRLRAPAEDMPDPADPATGLLGRSGLEVRLKGEVRRAERYRERFLLTLCAIAEFERLEARHGSAWAQSLVQEFASALQKNVREVDTPARIGAGRFAVLSPETEKDSGALLRRLDLLLPGLASVRGLVDPDEVRLVGNQYTFPDEVSSANELLGLLGAPGPFA